MRAGTPLFLGTHPAGAAGVPKNTTGPWVSVGSECNDARAPAVPKPEPSGEPGGLKPFRRATPVPPPASPTEGLAQGSSARGSRLGGDEKGGNLRRRRARSRRVSRRVCKAGSEVPTAPAAFGRLQVVPRVPGLALGCRLKEHWRSG